MCHCVEMPEHTQCIQARGHKAAAAGLDTKCNNYFASLENCAGVFESKMHTLILGSTLQKQKENFCQTACQNSVQNCSEDSKRRLQLILPWTDSVTFFSTQDSIFPISLIII